MKNFLKFWCINRISLIIFSWLVGFILFNVCDAFINMFLCAFLVIETIFGLTYIVESGKVNASERLMWYKYSKFLDKIMEE